MPLSHVLNVVGTSPRAKYVVFYAYDDDWESIDMADARHPQTLLAYGMNGGELPAPHGAPLRLRVPRQLGYKSFEDAIKRRCPLIGKPSAARPP